MVKTTLKIKTIVVRLIEEMDMCHPYDYYIDVIAQSNKQSDFTEACADELREAGEAYIDVCDHRL